MVMRLLAVFVTLATTVSCALACTATLPTMTFPKCPHTFVISKFTLDSGQGAPAQSTTVEACYNSTHLNSYFTAVDNNIVAPYSQCNDHLYNADVVEMFIGPFSKQTCALSGVVKCCSTLRVRFCVTVTKYFEFEVSPNVSFLLLSRS